MYHVIARPAPGAPLPGLYVAPSLFAAQMHALAAAGYQAVTLAQALAIWTGRTLGPPHPVVLSFDDGYTSVYRSALPILRGMHWPGVLCQQVQRIGFPGGFSAAQIRTMLNAGWELADHAITQPEVDLTTATPAVIHQEVFTSRAELRQRFGRRVRFFCYPVGHYDPTVEAAVRAAGFAGALSTVFGPADPAVEGMDRLERLRVWAGESPAQLLAIVRHAATIAPPPPPSSFPSPPPAQPARRAPRPSAPGTAQRPASSNRA
jgi:peptidoglycan/xylan/chitin deacetylase (PgdA/CDA1 family)